MQEVVISDSVIRLNSLLKLLNIASSGGEAKHLILDGNIKVNNEICTVIRKQLHPGDIITVDNTEYKLIEKRD